MASPVRMPAGINNVDYTQAIDPNGETNYNGSRNSHPLYMFPQPDPFRLIYVGNDFLDSPIPGSYVTTVVGTGTAASIAGIGGIFSLATSSAAGDSVAWQNSPGDFAFSATGEGWFHSLFTATDATNSELLLGITNTTTTPLTATDGFYFHKNSATTNIDLVIMNAGVATTVAAITTLASNTAKKLSLYYNGRGTLSYYANNAKLGEFTNTSAFPSSAIALGTQFYIKNGAAASQSLQLDYYLAATESTR